MQNHTVVGALISKGKHLFVHIVMIKNSLLIVMQHAGELDDSWNIGRQARFID